MSLLTVDVGGAAITLRCQKAGHAEPREVGKRRYSFYGRERSMIRAELQVVPLILYLMSPTAAAAIRTLFANGAQVVCEGDVFNNANANITCSGEITDEAEPGLLFSDEPWVLNLTLYEVENAGTVGV
jgi:hypothetical protein